MVTWLTSKDINQFCMKISHLKLTHWGRVTHTCVRELTTNDSDNGLSPGRRQAIIWTNAGILLIGPLGTNFSEILIEIQTFSLKKIRLKMSSAKCCSFRLGLNVLMTHFQVQGDHELNMIAFYTKVQHWNGEVSWVVILFSHLRGGPPSLGVSLTHWPLGREIWQKNLDPGWFQ